MLKMVVFVNGRQLSFVSVYAHISCIAQVTFKFLYYTLLVDNGGLGFLHLKIFIELLTYKHRLDGSFYYYVDGHKRNSSSIYKHYHLQHNDWIPQRFLEQFHVLAKCTNKFDCLIHEMLFIRKLKPELNEQTDSIRAKVFV